MNVREEVRDRECVGKECEEKLEKIIIKVYETVAFLYFWVCKNGDGIGILEWWKTLKPWTNNEDIEQRGKK